MTQTSFFDFKSNPFLDPKTNPFLDPKNNPFLDATKNPFLNSGMAEMFTKMQTPHLDFSDIAETQRKNFEAIATANKTAVEGVQAVMKRQGEIMKEIVDEMTALSHEVSATSAPDEQLSKNVDTVKQAIEEAVANMKELSEMMAKSQTEAFEILNGRLTESLEEVKKAVKKAKK